MLQVEAPGFQSWIQSVVVFDAPQTVDVILPVGGVTERVVVAAPRLEEELPQEIERAGTRVQTITSAQIENGGYNDVAQALQSLVPGLYLSPLGGAFDYVSASFQGSRTNEILWLVDGVRISNRLYNGVTPLDTLPAHMVERIEVLEGGQGLGGGPGAHRRRHLRVAVHPSQHREVRVDQPLGVEPAEGECGRRRLELYSVGRREGGGRID